MTKTHCLITITHVFLFSIFDMFLGTISNNNLATYSLISFFTPDKIFEGFSPSVPQTNQIFVEGFEQYVLSSGDDVIPSPGLNECRQIILMLYSDI